MAELPAGDGDHAVGLQVIEIFAKGLDGVQIVFAERERPRRGRGPGVDQRHLHHIELLRRRAQERAAVGHVNVHIGTLVKMLRVVGITLAHDGGGDDGIDLDPGHAGTAVRHGAQNVDAAARSDDGELPVRSQNIGQRRRRRHKVALPLGIVPVRQVGIHDVGGSVGVDDDRFGLPLAVDFHARERIPAGKLHPCRVAEHALGIDHIDQTPGVVRADQDDQNSQQGRRHFCQRTRLGPDHSGGGHSGSRDQDDVGSTHPIQQGDDRQAGQRSAAEVGAVQTRDASRLAREYDCEQKSGKEEGDRRRQVQSTVSRAKFPHETRSATGTCSTISSTTRTTTEFAMHNRAASERVSVPASRAFSR